MSAIVSLEPNCEVTLAVPLVVGTGGCATTAGGALLTEVVGSPAATGGDVGAGEGVGIGGATVT